MLTIIDTHTHLYDLPDAPDVLANCVEGGVSDIVVLGVDVSSNKKHLQLKTVCPVSLKIHLAFGLHPGNITTPQDTEDCFAFMRERLHEAVAVGEIGLDYHYKWVKSDENKQREQKDVFGRQLALAKEFNLPAVVHSRSAYRDSLDMTREAGVGKSNFHWYTGPLDILKEILDAGFLVSVSPSLEYSPEARAVALYAPLDRLLVETDTPVRGWNPRDVWRTLRLLSELKGVAEDEVLAMVNGNAQAFFGI